MSKYITPDGREFEIRLNAIRYMRDNNIPGAPITAKVVRKTTKPKTIPSIHEEIYFLPIFGLRLVTQSLIEIPKSMLENENSAHYENVRNYHKNMMEILDGKDTNKKPHQNSFWKFIAWILKRMPENYDIPQNYYNQVYEDFLRDLRLDMIKNNELYGHRKNCTMFDKNYEYIVSYWNDYFPKEGFDGEMNKYSNPYYNSDFGTEEAKYFNNPLYWHDRHGWGLALTGLEVSLIKKQLNKLSERQFSYPPPPVQRGHQIIDVRYILPERLNRGGLVQSLRPLLATQGIFCPCRCNDIHHKRLIKSTIDYLLEERLLFKLSGDEFGSLKLINWPYDDPQI